MRILMAMMVLASGLVFEAFAQDAQAPTDMPTSATMPSGGSLLQKYEPVAPLTDADIQTNKKVSKHHILKMIPAMEAVTKVPAYKSCEIFKRPDGRPYKVILGYWVKAGGTCPPDYVIGRLIGTKDIEINGYSNRIETRHRICTLTSNGSCGQIRLLGHPTIPSSTVFSMTDYLPDAGEQTKDVNVIGKRQGNKVLHIAQARGFLSVIPGDWSSCKSFYVNDGTGFVYRGQVAAASGNCPPELFIPAKLVGEDEIQIRNRVFKLGANGKALSRRTVSESLPRVMPNNGTTW